LRKRLNYKTDKGHVPPDGTTKHIKHKGVREVKPKGGGETSRLAKRKHLSKGRRKVARGCNGTRKERTSQAAN